MTVEFISERGGNSSAGFQRLEVLEADEAALLITAHSPLIGGRGGYLQPPLRQEEAGDTDWRVSAAVAVCFGRMGDDSLVGQQQLALPQLQFLQR